MKPHRTDGISLSFGLIFLLVALWWAVAQVATVRLPAAGWLVAGGLIMFGVIGLLGAIRSGRRAEVPTAAPARNAVETPGDLPPELHADIVRELMDNPADRTDLNPAYLKHPAPAPVSGGPAVGRPETGAGQPSGGEAPAGKVHPAWLASEEATASAAAEHPEAGNEVAGSESAGGESTLVDLPVVDPAGPVTDEPTVRVRRVDEG